MKEGFKSRKKKLAISQIS